MVTMVSIEAAIYDASNEDLICPCCGVRQECDGLCDTVTCDNCGCEFKYDVAFF